MIACKTCERFFVSAINYARCRTDSLEIILFSDKWKITIILSNEKYQAVWALLAIKLILLQN